MVGDGADGRCCWWAQRAGDARCENTVGTNHYVAWMAVAVTWVAIWYTCARITSPDTIWIGVSDRPLRVRGLGRFFTHFKAPCS